MTNGVLLGQSVHTPSTVRFRYERERADAPEHPSSLALLEYWREHEAQGGMRMGRDVPARRLAKVISGIAITEPIGDWSDGRIRHAGMVYTTRFGRDITGMTIRDLYTDDPDGGEALLEGAKLCIAQRCTLTLRTRVLDRSNELMRFEVLVLPIWSPDGETLWAMAGTYRI